MEIEKVKAELNKLPAREKLLVKLLLAYDRQKWVTEHLKDVNIRNKLLSDLSLQTDQSIEQLTKSLADKGGAK